MGLWAADVKTDCGYKSRPICSHGVHTMAYDVLDSDTQFKEEGLHLI